MIAKLTWKVTPLILGLAALFGLLWQADALATSPELAYQDFLRHGTLTQEYTASELYLVLSDPVIAMYADSEVRLHLYAVARRMLQNGLRQPKAKEIAVLALVSAILVGAGVNLGARKMRNARITRAHTGTQSLE